MDKIIVGIASIKSREKSLKEVIRCLERQNNVRPIINIYLNDYLTKPSFLNKSFINVFLGAENAGDLGDAGKFYKVGECEDVFYASCDDDLFYSPNYLENMISGVKRYGGVVTIHGSILTLPVNNYYRERKLISFKRDLHKSVGVHIAGTGVSCFHTNDFKLSISDFPQKNMADLFFAVKTQREKIGITCLAHKGKSLVKEISGVRKNSIFQQFVNNEEKSKQMRDVINTVSEWKLH